MKTYWSIALLSLSLCFQAVAQSSAESATTPVPRNDRSKARFDLLTERVKSNPGNYDILFVGDSITQGWEFAGSNTWKKINERYKVMNIGIGGDRTQHVLWRLDNGHAEGLNPKVTVLMIGTNNSGDDRNTAEEMVEGVTAVVEKLKEKFPQTKILLLGIFPRGEKFNAQRGKILQVNQVIQKLADDKQVFWLDFGHIFVNRDGTISKEIMPDFLHLTPRGYEMWLEAMEPKVKELLRK